MKRIKPLILIVDDNPQNLQIVGEKIEQSGYDAAIATNGTQAYDFAKTNKPDLVLLDIMMPMVDGFDVCRLFKDNPVTSGIPVIFLTARTDYDDITRAFELGAVDYVIKPFNVMELNARIKTHLDLKYSREQLIDYNKELEKTNQELKQANKIISEKNIQLGETMKQLEIAARTDPLTNLLNRRRIIELIEIEAIRFARNKKLFSIVIADIDFFKSINDNYGHDEGDVVLKSIADTITATIRKQDSVSRWGGEEFLILLPETDANGAKNLTGKIREKLAVSSLVPLNIDLKVTMTFGIAEYDENIFIDSTIKKADIALYEGKNKGRNCVVIYKGDAENKT
ncbi:MAG: diguanylate cyclase [Spirochaetes bacterium]|nr:diguanylate cyclase [Spirochaetota bacterium]